jgi:acetylornithine/N-succinyldiaminopimelate aminotransferase
MKLEQLIELEKKYVVPSYKRSRVSFVKGEGSWLTDSRGKKYLDLFAGIAVCSLGHANKTLNRALSSQSGKLWHTSNLFYIEPQMVLAEKLSKLSNGGKVFFSNSGAEANEAAIKLSRLFAHNKTGNRTAILSLEQSFHGRTLATVTATGQTKYQKGFDPLPKGFAYVKFNDVRDLVRKAGRNVCAIMLEFIQGEGGLNTLKPEFVAKVKELAKKYGFLVIADEVQAGLCRTGKFFAWQHYDIVPDIITLAKALGNGMPIGAMIARSDVADHFTAGRHASTFGGNFLSTAVANAVIDIMKSQKIDKAAAKKGVYFRKILEGIRKDFPQIIEGVKGLGLMAGLALRPGYTAGPFVVKAMELGLVIGQAGDNVLRFVPPLTISEKELSVAGALLRKIL